MHLGICYYPEHWPRERWPIDAQLMQQAGLTYVRIAEFAWQRMEPAEGAFDWDWLDEAIAVLSDAGLQVILGTPTAAPPAWLTHAYPEVCAVDAEGRAQAHGARRHYCFTQPTYHRHTERIVSALAERYGHHPAVVGWQIDNEFGCHDTVYCYCDSCAAAFRDWLRARYQTLDALNAAWGTVFWSQTYTAWEQIPLPHRAPAYPNPSHALDYIRFASDAVVAYQQRQLDILRAHIAPTHFVTHNLLGKYPEINGYDLARPLDFICWDSYPTGYAEFAAGDFDGALYGSDDAPGPWAYDLGDPYVTGFCHALTYGFKQHPFWVMEQQIGQVNWARYNPGVRPGALRLWTWHAAAAGADAVVYFRWRACRFAQEQYHSGLLHHDSNLDTGYDELLALQDEREPLAALTAAPVTAQVALLFDYDDWWALRLQPHHRDYDYLREHFRYYRALTQLGLTVALLPYEADLSAYPLVIAPSAHIGTEERAARLTAYVEQGGALLLGARSGFKTPENLVTADPLPGPFRALVGATVVAWHSLPPGAAYGLRSLGPNLTGMATGWAECLAPSAPQTETLVAYSDGPWEGYAALTRQPLGNGQALYLGWRPTLEQTRALLIYLARGCSLERGPQLPEGLVALQRGEQRLVFNFTDQPQRFTHAGRQLTVAPRDFISLSRAGDAYANVTPAL